MISIFKRVINRILRIRKSILIPSLIIILALLSFGIFKFVEFYNYMEHDPEFCLSCHIMEDSWNKWATSAHKDIECHACHKQSIFAGINQLISYAFKDYDTIETHAEVPSKYCMACHESGSSNWIQVANTAGHSVHAEREGIYCVDCHSSSVHRFEPLSLVCGECHTDQYIQIDSMASMHCDACHNFIAEDDKLLPERKSCLNCHEALAQTDILWPADAPMQIDCGDCHQPHNAEQPLIECTTCHSPAGMHLEGAHQASSCITCHHQHEWVVTERDTCTQCHAAQVDHKTGTNCAICHDFK